MKIRVALAGNPNCGKTTMFNTLTGSSQYVGNWPGVTVEKKEGKLKGHRDVIVTDLPGIYSLSPYTMEEIVTRKYITEEKPDVIINIVDGTNLERNLYLTDQLAEVGIPMLIVVNMMDIVRKNGDEIDFVKLEKEYSCKVMEMAAISGKGVFEAAEAALKLSFDSIHSHEATAPSMHKYNDDVEAVLRQINSGSRWSDIKIFERDKAFTEELTPEIENNITAVEEKYGDDSVALIINHRYDEITRLMKVAYKKGAKGMSTTQKIDRVVTNRWLAIPIFATVMFLIYYISVTTLGALVTDWTNDVFFGEWIMPGVGGLLENLGAAPWLQGLIVDGIIGGVGAVLGFVPQMFILFLFLSFLEECGYMSRVAFMMDRIFRRFGLSGKSFIPMLISSGCGVPGIMATKTIENDKNRRMTIMTTTFIPCGAKLPVIALISGAIMGGAWWMAPAMYFLGIIAVLISGIILKKASMFSGEESPFVMELPAYHKPAIKNVMFHVWERCKAFIIKAGTVIFVACGIIWFLSNFGMTDGGFGMTDATESILANLGHILGFIFAPLGFGQWQASVATISGLVAKESIVGTLAVLGADAQTLFSTTAAGMSFLIFNLLCAPCFAAIGAIKREMNDMKWTAFALAYQTGFAYAVALMVYQFSMVAVEGFTVGTGAATIVLALLIYLILRKPKGVLREELA